MAIRGQIPNKRGKPKPTVERFVFGANFKAAREQLGLSQRETAQGLRVNQPFISAVETGAANLTIERMALLARFIGVPLFELLRTAAIEDNARGPSNPPTATDRGGRR